MRDLIYLDHLGPSHYVVLVALAFHAHSGDAEPETGHLEGLFSK